MTDLTPRNAELLESQYAIRRLQEEVVRLKEKQQPDGSFSGEQGVQVSTTLSLLALAVNYRFLPIYER